MIVDTNIIIRILQGDTRAIEKVAELESRHVDLNVSAVTVFELYHSLERVNNPSERLAHVEDVLESKPIYSADDAVMKKAGRIDGRLSANVEEIGMSDTIIGATALIHEEPVLTENVSHFERIDGLSIETYQQDTES